MVPVTHTLPASSTLNNNLASSTPSKLKNLGMDILKASVLAVSMSATAYPFVASVNVSLLKILTISAIGAAVILKQFIRLTDPFFETIQNNPNISTSMKKVQAYGQKFLNYYPHLTLSLLDLTTRLPLIHEKGHALIGKLLYKNANPSIEIVPLSDGFTKLVSNQLSPLGEKLGAEKSYLCFASAGPVFATLFNLVDLTIAHATTKSSPDLNKFLITSVITNTARHVVYALSVLFKSYDGHDFLPIWKIGKVHPIVASALIVATPVTYQLFLNAMFPEKKENTKKTVSA